MKQYSKDKRHNIICIQKNQVPIPIFEMDIFCFSEVSLKVAKPTAYPKPRARCFWSCNAFHECNESLIALAFSR